MAQVNLEIVLVHNRVVRRKSAERIFLHLNAHIGDAAVRRGGQQHHLCVHSGEGKFARRIYGERRDCVLILFPNSPAPSARAFSALASAHST